MTIEYVKKSALIWSNLWTNLGMEKDNAGRWYPGENSPQFVIDYLSTLRPPSRAFPNSYAKSLLTQKFAKLLTVKNPSLAVDLGVAENH